VEISRGDHSMWMDSFIEILFDVGLCLCGG